MKLLFTYLFLICVVVVVDGANVTQHPHLLTHPLPKMGELPPFKMYTGYLKASKHGQQQIFYWLNEGVNDNKHLLIWLNGGPGCSSLYGMFRENGPFMFNEETGNITKNKLSWNRFAHTLYLDSPMNTGFSYSKKPVHKQNDRTALTHLVHAIKNFFQIHPQYEDFNIFLAGESYAGVYIPTAAVRILKEKSKLADKFKGILLGNPYLSKYLNEKSRAEFSYSHGFIEKNDYKQIEEFDCFNQTALNNTSNQTKDFCNIQTEKIAKSVYQPMNLYNLEKKCWKTREKFMLEESGFGSGSGDYYYDDINVTSTSVLKEVPDESDDVIGYDGGLDEDEDCYATPKLEKYLNRNDVKSAIGANKKITWKACNNDVNENYDKIYTDMSWRIKKIINHYGKTALLYYGDLDFLCNFMGGEEFVRGLNLKKTKKRSSFYLKQGKKETLAGNYEMYENRLKFAVIKGAGHMAPEDQPAETYSLIRQWLNSKRHDVITDDVIIH